ncbi:ice-binding family protein [Rhodohalobacter sp.]|uniref:ice-binding family protein n=1 Tax=Rhodohalobacter sp. TaxID=1974210 RepID=UPI0035660B6E
MNKSEYSANTADKALKAKNNWIDLGKAGQFVILAQTNINNKSESMITGHTGEGSVKNGTNKEKQSSHSERKGVKSQALILQSNQSDTTYPDVNEAIKDLLTAYSDASMQNGDDITVHETGGLHSNDLTSGVHEWSDSLHIASDVNFSGGEDDVWLIKIGSDLTIDENIVFTLNDGAQSDNIFWYVEGEVTIGKDANFEGIILSMNEITLEDDAILNGRMFSQASITLNDNTVTEPRNMIAGRTTSTNK